MPTTPVDLYNSVYGDFASKAEASPRAPIVELAQAATTDRQWAAFVRRYRSEMAAPDKRRLLDLLAAMSREADFSVGCYCADESRCHRSALRMLLGEPGAQVA